MNNLSRLKLFAMKSLLLEADLGRLEKGGVSLGHLQTVKTDPVVDTELFESDILAQAHKMADFYVLYYCVENSIRRLIAERLEEKYGAGWWDAKVPDAVKTEVARLQKNEKDSVFSVRSDDQLSYTTFGELLLILDANWDDFSDTIRSRKGMRQVLSQFNMSRGVIAHSCELKDDEIMRLELLVKDWLRIQT